MKTGMKKALGWFLALTMLLSLISGVSIGNAEGLSGTITISTEARAGSQEAWEAVAKAYTAMHPDVNVVVDLKATEGYPDWITTISTLDELDVDIAEFTMGTFDHTRLLELSDYADVDSPYSDGTFGEQVETAALGTSQVTGEQVLLSPFSTQVLWIYNVDIFEKVGVSIPTTWDEFVDVCAKIQEAGYQPIATNYASALGSGWLPWIYMDQTTRPLINIYRAHEGDYCYDPDIDGVWEYNPDDPWNDDTDKVNQNLVRVLAAVKDGTYAMNTPGYKTVWEQFLRIFPQYAGGDAFFGSGEGISDSFYRGEAAMTLQGGWALIDFQRTLAEVRESGIYTDENGNALEAKAFTLGTFGMPTMEGEGIVSKARTIEVPSSGFTILSKDQAHNDLVMDFVMYYTSPEGMNTYIDTFLASGGSLDGPCLVKGVTYPEEYASIFDNLTSIGNCQKGYGYVFAVGVPGVDESAREFSNNAYELLNGRMTVEEFLDLAQQNLQTYIPVLQQYLNISDADIANPASAPVGF